jgi:ATP-binding protein involved in chromosome partitioning
VQTRQNVVGVVENMSWLAQPDGSRLELFGSGGGQRVADNLSTLTGRDVPLLGQVPLDVRLREAGDSGRPVVLSEPDSPAAETLRGVARSLGARRRGLAGRSLGLSPAAR